jgi:acetyltransferase-like isoleucine patch superfamily enzyme
MKPVDGILWALQKGPMRRLLWCVSRLAEDQDLSVRLLRGFDYEAAQERLRVLRRRGITIGDSTILGRAHFDARVWALEIGSLCAVLDDCVIIAHDVDSVVTGNREHVTKVRIRDNSVLLPGVCVLPGVSIGPNAVVGPRSLVAQDIPPNTYAAGHPARPICSLADWLTECQQRLTANAGLFTLLPADGGYRDRLLRAWCQNVPGQMSTPGHISG